MGVRKIWGFNLYLLIEDHFFILLVTFVTPQKLDAVVPGIGFCAFIHDDTHGHILKQLFLEVLIVDHAFAQYFVSLHGNRISSLEILI